MPAVLMPRDLGLVQRERLAITEFRCDFVGSVSRICIFGCFAVRPGASTRGLALYRAIAPSSISYDGSSQSHSIGTSFSPLVDHPLDRGLLSLSKCFGDVLGEIRPIVPFEFAEPINKPLHQSFAPMARGIAIGSALSISYVLDSLGESVSEILEFVLADNGLHWHVSAFDRKSSSFRDFVLSRISNPLSFPEWGDIDGERPADDVEWNATIDLDVVAHPNSACPEIIALDFSMENGLLRQSVRAASAGDLLDRWRIDCSPTNLLDPVAHLLWLRNHSVLEGVLFAAIAPGRAAAIRGAE